MALKAFLIPQLFIEHVLCSKHYSKAMGHSSEQSKDPCYDRADNSCSVTQEAGRETVSSSFRLELCFSPEPWGWCSACLFQEDQRITKAFFFFLTVPSSRVGWKS